MKRVTINDIARASGYSKTAVSFAFNQPGRISGKARAAILETADRLGYIPDPYARNLSRSSSDTIGILLPQPVAYSLQNPHLVQILQGIGKQCHLLEKSFSLIPPVKGRLPELAGEAAVDGMIAIGLDPDAGVLEAIEKRQLPFVTIDADPSPGIPSVGIDDRAAAKDAMARILQLGHRRIALLGLQAPDPPARYRYSNLHAKRVLGIEEAMRLYAGGEAKGKAGDMLRRLSCEPTIDAGFQTARQLFTSPQEAPTAILSFSDATAAGVLAGLHSVGIRVPEEVSIISFDGSAYTSITSPLLSTIVQPGEEKGIRAALLLFDLIAGKPAASEILPYYISEGETLGPAPPLPGR